MFFILWTHHNHTAFAFIFFRLSNHIGITAPEKTPPGSPLEGDGHGPRKCFLVVPDQPRRSSPDLSSAPSWGCQDRRKTPGAWSVRRWVSPVRRSLSREYGRHRETAVSPRQVIGPAGHTGAIHTAAAYAPHLRTHKAARLAACYCACAICSPTRHPWP